MAVDFRDIAIFSVFMSIALFINFYLQLIPLNWILGIIGIPAVLAGVSYLLVYLNDKRGSQALTSSIPGASDGTGFYNTAIEPAEAWEFANNRIDELQDVPYRKIDTDSSNYSSNKHTKQQTGFANIGGSKTRITMIKGKPLNARADERVAYLIDLSVPSIHDWSGLIRREQGTIQGWDSEHGFYISEGAVDEMDEPEKGSGSAFVEINEGGRGEKE